MGFYNPRFMTWYFKSDSFYQFHPHDIIFFLKNSLFILSDTDEFWMELFFFNLADIHNFVSGSLVSASILHHDPWPELHHFGSRSQLSLCSKQIKLEKTYCSIISVFSFIFCLSIQIIDSNLDWVICFNAIDEMTSRIICF